MKFNKAFDKVSIEDWEKKIVKELKIEALSQKQWNIGEDISLSPAYFHDKKRNVALPDPTAQLNDWGIGEDFAVKNYEKSNKALLEALQAGSEFPGLSLKTIPKQSEWKTLLNEIRLDYIKIQFNLDKEVKPMPFIRSFHKYLDKNYSKPKKIAGVISFEHKSKYDAKVISLGLDLLPGFKTICLQIKRETKTIGSEKVLANALIELEKIIFDLRDNGISISKIGSNIAIQTFASKSFYLSLSKIRATKLLVLNLLMAYKFKKSLDVPIIAYTDPKEYVEDPNTNNIIASTQVMGAVLAGVERMVVSPPNKSRKHTNFSRRISRNIQHIMKMESGLNLVHDSAAGSYFMDELSGQLMDKAWQIFIEKTEEK